MLIFWGSKLLINVERGFCWLTGLTGFITWLYKSSDAAQGEGGNLYLEMMRKAESASAHSSLQAHSIGLSTKPHFYIA